MNPSRQLPDGRLERAPREVSISGQNPGALRSAQSRADDQRLLANPGEAQVDDTGLRAGDGDHRRLGVPAYYPDL